MMIKQIFVKSQVAICLGKQGENEVVEVIFPQPAELMAEEWQLNHQRATDREAYPCPLEKRKNSLVWRVTSGDTAVPGIGAAELACYGKDGEILKSRTYSTSVLKSITTGGEPPDPVKPWYDAIMDAIESGGGGGSGEPGEDGGYYTPSVEQTAENTLVIGYNPSKDGMPAVEPVEIDLLPGPPGDSTEATAAAEAAAESAEAARVAAEAVENALPSKLDKPTAAPTVGQVLRVLSVNDDGTFTCGWDTPQSGGVADVQVAGQSIVSDGVAAIPCVPGGWQGASDYALYQLNQAYGICAVDTGRLAIVSAPEAELSARTSNYKAIVPRNLDKAVKIALCDGKGDAYTDAERLAALLRLGCAVDDDGFVKWEASAE